MISQEIFGQSEPLWDSEFEIKASESRLDDDGNDGVIERGPCLEVYGSFDDIALPVVLSLNDAVSLRDALSDWLVVHGR